MFMSHRGTGNSLAETILELDRPLATNITTLELISEAQHTRLKVTVQVTLFVGAGMITNTKDGYEGSLANMARYLEPWSRARAGQRGGRACRVTVMRVTYRASSISYLDHLRRES